MGKKRTKGKNILQMSHQMYWHLRKGLEQGLLKKVLQTVDLNSCQDCQIDDNKTDEKSDKSAEDKPSIWLCLKCGHRGCGRNCQEQHALKHYEMPRSEPHCLVLNVENWCVWCYLCDDEIQYNSSSRLGQLVGFIRKQTCVNIPNTGQLLLKPQNEEEKEKKEILFKDNKSQLNGNSEMTVKGLSNLGNTCFFNAVLQNLSQTSVLRELLKEAKMPDSTIILKPPDFSITEPLVVMLDPPRPLTLAMCQFLADIELFSQICKKATRFKGYQQQDSQELLRYLLDGMRTEEIQRTSAAIFKALNNSDKGNEDLKKEVKEYEKKKLMHSFVDRIFGGELTSTIMCEECQTVSDIYVSMHACIHLCVYKFGGSTARATRGFLKFSSSNRAHCDQEANNEVNLDVSIKGFVPTIECVNKFDDLHLKEDKDEEDEDIISDFSKLFLEEEEPSDDTDSLQEFYGFETQTYEVVNEDPETAFRTLADRDTINIEENSILHCLNQFTHIEKLCENNKLLCEACTRNQCCGIKTNKINAKKYVYTNAKKQMLISLAPPILTLHLKRFQQAGYNLQKVNKHIMFPEVMDLAPFCSIKCKNVREGTSEVLYSLYGIVEHSGTMRSGHYTAYVKTSTTSQLSDLVNDKIQQTSESESPRRQWFHVSDTHVQAVSISKVLKSQAYLLFYERIL
uniref:Ubiquitin carboxyl-terminal hydrolase n=1 Tax=Naja naja TaxID=35670 RepID=A0A8C6XLP2_NAJNA